MRDIFLNTSSSKELKIVTSNAKLSALLTLLAREEAEQVMVIETIEDFAELTGCAIEQIRDVQGGCVFSGGEIKGGVFLIVFDAPEGYWEFVTDSEEVLALIVSFSEVAKAKVQIHYIPIIDKMEDMGKLGKEEYFGEIGFRKHEISKTPQA